MAHTQMTMHDVDRGRLHHRHGAGACFTLVTRNTRHLEGMNLKLLNPFF